MESGNQCYKLIIPRPSFLRWSRRARTVKTALKVRSQERISQIAGPIRLSKFARHPTSARKHPELSKSCKFRDAGGGCRQKGNRCSAIRNPAHSHNPRNAWQWAHGGRPTKRPLRLHRHAALALGRRPNRLWREKCAQSNNEVPIECRACERPLSGAQQRSPPAAARAARRGGSGGRRRGSTDVQAAAAGKE